MVQSKTETSHLKTLQTFSTDHLLCLISRRLEPKALPRLSQHGLWESAPNVERCLSGNRVPVLHPIAGKSSGAFTYPAVCLSSQPLRTPYQGTQKHLWNSFPVATASVHLNFGHVTLCWTCNLVAISEA